ncbi:MAG: hypothetical protein ACOC9H_00580, partial [Gemmatimonadota bacterium]
MQPASALGESSSTVPGRLSGARLRGLRRAVVPALLSVAAVAMEPGLPLPSQASSPGLADAQELPEGVTPEAVEEGRRIFNGPG